MLNYCINITKEGQNVVLLWLEIKLQSRKFHAFNTLQAVVQFTLLLLSSLKALKANNRMVGDFTYIHNPLILPRKKCNTSCHSKISSLWIFSLVMLAKLQEVISKQERFWKETLFATEYYMSWNQLIHKHSDDTCTFIQMIWRAIWQSTTCIK